MCQSEFPAIAGSTWKFLRDVCDNDMIGVRKFWKKCKGYKRNGIPVPSTPFQVIRQSLQM